MESHISMKAPGSDGPNELRQLEQICLPSWIKHRSKTFTLRPERPEYGIVTNHAQPNKAWQQVLNDLHAGLVGNGTFDEFVASICPNRTSSSRHFKHILKPAFSAVAAIRWELESRGRTPPACITSKGTSRGVSSETAPGLLYKLNSGIKPVPWSLEKVCRGFLKHLLLREFAPCSAEVVPTANCGQAFWDDLLQIAGQLVDFALLCGHVAPPWGMFVKVSNLLKQLAGDMDPTDVAVVLCQALYYSRRTIKGGALRRTTGLEHRYSLKEMIGDARHHKPERLQRKLSVDINEMLPRLIKNEDLRMEIIMGIQQIAYSNCIALYADTLITHRPGPEVCYRYGRLIKNGVKRIGGQEQWRARMRKAENMAKTLGVLVTASGTLGVARTWAVAEGLN